MREEIHTSHSHIFVVLQLFFPIVGVLLGMALEHMENRIILNSILSIAIPIISLSSITFTLSECICMKRAGDYICILESKVNFRTLSKGERKKRRKWQKKIERELNLGHSEILLSRPMIFESWIRDLSVKQMPYGGSSYILQLRFIIFLLSQHVLSYAHYWLDYTITSL